MRNAVSQTTKWLALALAGGLLASASTASAQAAFAGIPEASPTAGPTEVYDPWQGFNRPSFAFSMGVDRAVLRPVSQGYRAITPRPVRSGVTNVLNNLGEPSTVINDVAQGKLKRAGRATSRFAINSTIGLLGLFDVAAQMGLKPHDSDFGQTLGRYGAQPGPYLYVPVMGPFVLRDGLGRIVDVLTDPASIVGGGIDTTFGATRTGLTIVDVRTRAEPAFRALEDATDPYATARSAYVQHRAFVVQNATGEAADLPDFDSPPTQ